MHLHGLCVYTYILYTYIQTICIYIHICIYYMYLYILANSLAETVHHFEQTKF